MEDNYLIVREYEERISDSKSSRYPNFIEFKHSNGKFYFAWIKDQKIFMRSEGYATASSRDHGLASVLNNRFDKNNYRTESAHGAHFLILLASNNKEIARSFPMKEEIETFITLNRIEENEEATTSTEVRNNTQEEKEEANSLVDENSEISTAESNDVVEEKVEAEVLPTAEVKEIKIEEVETKIEPEDISLDKPNLISSPLLDSFRSEVKAESIQTTELAEEKDKEALKKNIVSVDIIEETERKETIVSPDVDLDYFDEDKLVNVAIDKPLSEIIEEKKVTEEKIETKLGSILAEEEKTHSKTSFKWLLWLFFLALIVGLLWWMFKLDGCQRIKKIIPIKTAAIDTLPIASQNGIKADSGMLDQASIEAKASWEKTLGGMVAIRLPDGSLINVPENGTEKKLVEYLDAKCGTSEIKKTWFDMDRILFKSGTDQLMPISDEQIILLAKIFKSYPNKKFKIGGYTDNVGDPEANIRLSAIRAGAATRAIAAIGIDSVRMRYEGYGQEHPICPANDTEECRAKNRRVAIRVDVCE